MYEYTGATGILGGGAGEVGGGVEAPHPLRRQSEIPAKADEESRSKSEKCDFKGIRDR
jgi:hypothetical protein